MPVPSVYAALRGLLESQKYTDLTIFGDREQFHVHRAVICSQSPAFARACDSKSDSDSYHPQNHLSDPQNKRTLHRSRSVRFLDEKKATLLLLQGVEDDMLKRVIDYLYTGNYHDGEHPPIHQTQPSSALLTDQAEPQEPQSSNIISIPSSPASHGSVDLGHKADDMDVEPVEMDDRLMLMDSLDEELLRKDLMYEFNDDKPAHDDLETDSTDTAVLNTANPHAMFTNLRLYMLAIVFEIDSLKDLARQRFFKSCVRHIDHEDFPAVMDELFTNTAKDDVLMHEFPCRIIAPRIRLFHDNFKSRIEPIMHKHGVLATGVMNYIIYSSYSRVIGVGAACPT